MFNSEKLKVIGNKHFKEAQELTEISINGVATFHQDVQAESFHILGRCKVKRAVQADRFVNKGSCSVNGKLTCNQLVNIGQGSFNLIEANNIESSGSLETTDSISCKTFQSMGHLKLKGGLICERASIEVSAPSEVSEIKVTDEVTIKLAKLTLLNVKSLIRKKMVIGSIHGKNVDLEHTQASQVFGEVVKIGSNCKVDEVFYKEALDVHPSAVVNKSNKV
ncbi:hypothetical protein [Paraliobacillus sp. JSM ZJ581]|uniref:hypothetical protein n=1 Tax=Paraliobacillus sp. JSM ZJ581 TaxID=3342118 RepID=UPI0035A98208